MNKEKLIPRLRFKSFLKNLDWKYTKLGEVADIVGGGTPSTQVEKYWNGDINWFSPTEIDETSYLNSSERKITKLGLKKSSAKILPIGTVLFTSRAGIGKTAILEKESTTNQGFQSIVPKKNILNSYFIYSRSEEIKNYAEIVGAGSTFVEVSGKQLEKMMLLIPELKEQQKIGSFFKKIDKMIQLQQSKVNKVKDIKSAYLSEMFPKEGEKYPKKRFEGFTELWEEYKLKDMGRSLTGLSGKSKKDFGHGEAEFVTYMNVFNNPIAKSTQTAQVEVDENQTEVEYGDIFFTVSSETPNEVGMSSVWLYNRPNVYLNSFCFGFRPTINLNPYYMAYMLRSPEIRKRFILLAQGISRYNISKTKAMELLFPIPSNEEQEKIGHFFKNLDNQISIEEEKLAKLEKLKQAYLNDMFV